MTTACFIPEAVNQIWPTCDVKRHLEQIRDLKDKHMPAPELLCSFQHITAIFTAQNYEHFTIALYKWTPSFFGEGSPIYHFALLFNFSLSRSKSIQYSKVLSTYDHLPWVWPLQSNVLSLCASVTSGFLPSPEFWKASLEAIVRLKAEHERPHFVPTVPFTPSAAHFTLSFHSHYKKKIPKKVIYI